MSRTVTQYSKKMEDREEREKKKKTEMFLVQGAQVKMSMTLMRNEKIFCK